MTHTFEACSAEPTPPKIPQRSELFRLTLMTDERSPLALCITVTESRRSAAERPTTPLAPSRIRPRIETGFVRGGLDVDVVERHAWVASTAGTRRPASRLAGRACNRVSG